MREAQAVKRKLRTLSKSLQRFDRRRRGREERGRATCCHLRGREEGLEEEEVGEGGEATMRELSWLRSACNCCICWSNCCWREGMER